MTTPDEPITPSLSESHDATTAAIRAILDLLHSQARTDATLRAHLATLGQALIAIATPAATIIPTIDLVPVEQPITARTDTLPAAPTDLSSIQLTQTKPPPHPATPASPPATRDDLERLRRAFQGHTDAEPDQRSPVVAQGDAELPDEATFLGELSSCCAAKAACIRQAQTRMGAPLTTTDDACDYWMEPLFTKLTISSTDWVILASAYAVAMVVETLADVLNDSALVPFRTTGFDLMAEAQSALRAAVLRVRPRPDPSQEVLFQWLRRRAQADSIFIKRYMRMEDVADPADWLARMERIGAWREDVEDLIYRRRHERNLAGKLRYQLQQVRRGTMSEWPRSLQTIESLMEHGMPPSSRMLREILLPYRTELMAECERSPNIARIVRAWERIPGLPSSEQRTDGRTTREEPQINQVADLLRNTAVVLIGGDERPRVAQTIEETFDLCELVWCDTRPHKSHLPLEPAIARADVSVVLLAIRWASHGLSDVRTFCERYQKPFVRLPGGYNVSQLAYQIVQQASERLTVRRTEEDRGNES